MLKKIWEILLKILGILEEREIKDVIIKDDKQDDTHDEPVSTLKVIDFYFDKKTSKIRVLTNEPCDAYLSTNGSVFKLHSKNPYKRKDGVYSHAKKIELKKEGASYQWELVNEKNESIKSKRMSIFKSIILEGAEKNNNNTPPTASGSNNYPVMNNFRIENSNPNRLYFDTNNVMNGVANKNGFFIGDGTDITINSINVNTGTTTGHYFVLSRNVTFWDNITLRYEGGSTLKDSSNLPILPFTLSYIVNNIPEPSTTITKYVTTTATGGGNGDSEASAWTWQEAFDNATAGTTVWIKAGNYGHLNLKLRVKGTPTNPIKFIGYKSTVGDITTNYLDGATMSITQSNLLNNWDVSEMPTLTGLTSNSRAEDDNAILIGDKVGTTKYDVYNVFLKNIQIEKYNNGIKTINYLGLDFHNLVIDNINGRTFMYEDYDINQTKSKTYNTFLSISTQKNAPISGTYTLCNNMKIMNIIAEGGGLNNVRTLGEGSNLFKNVKLFTSDQTNRTTTNTLTRSRNATDYYLAFNGDNNIAIDCHVYNQNTFVDGGYNAVGHGIGVRGESRWKTGNASSYNLISDCSAYQMGDAFYVRSTDSHHNVIKNVTYDRPTVTGVNGKPDYYNGSHWKAVSFYGKVNDNVAENITANNCSIVIEFRDDDNEDGNTSRICATNNVAKNITATNFSLITSVSGKNQGESTPDNDDSNYGIFNGNKIIGGTFTNGMRLYDFNYAKLNGLELRNLIINDFSGSLYDVVITPSTRRQNNSAYFTNCNFWNVNDNSKNNYRINNFGELINNTGVTTVVNALSLGNTNLNQ